MGFGKVSFMRIEPEKLGAADFSVKSKNSHIKMNELKPISHKEFNEFTKGKGFKGRNNYALKDLKAKFGFKPLIERRALVVSFNDMKPTKFDSMRKAAKSIWVGEGVIRYARNNEKDYVSRFEDERVKVFFIKWC